MRVYSPFTALKISIHAPREGCDAQPLTASSPDANFNPRTPRGVRPVTSLVYTLPRLEISIHAPREGCDGNHDADHKAVLNISIHAPREGCDVGCFNQIQPISDFNPRTPRGVRLLRLCAGEIRDLFQSTHPARGATSPGAIVRPGSLDISIHAPREGCDHDTKTVELGGVEFQSTHPARGATTINFRVHIDTLNFNPRTPRGVRLKGDGFSGAEGGISIHAPREGCDRKLYQRAESLLGSICLFAQGEEG